MNVFLSWSGPQSKKLAEAFREWLPSVLQQVRVYYSPSDLNPGTRWNADISKELAESSVGLIIVTRDNTTAPWIMFEAGALSKNLEISKVIPILFGLSLADLSGPLAQFQAVTFERTHMRQVIESINAASSDKQLSAERLAKVFDMCWPELENQVESTMRATIAAGAVEEVRDQRDVLNEILTITRALSKQSTRQQVPHRAINELIEKLTALGDYIVFPSNIVEITSAFISAATPVGILAARIGLTDESGKPLGAYAKFVHTLSMLSDDEEDDLPF